MQLREYDFLWTICYIGKIELNKTTIAGSNDLFWWMKHQASLKRENANRDKNFGRGFKVIGKVKLAVDKVWPNALS